MWKDINGFLKKIYNKGILQGIISKLYNIHGTSIMNAITIGNKTVQQ
jgi:hypothetical protein